ncbi:MAG: hypothetical protein FJ206_10390 [Gemmatimonadetes bacterium]|nr:hypothetical protein [Gemmatimonadota bacterium]
MSDLVLAATDRPLPIEVRRIEDDRVPDGLVGLGSYLQGRLIARCALSDDIATFLETRRIFAEPVQLLLAAREEPPGLQCRLFAVVAVEMPEEAEPEDPWAASVPGAGYEAAVSETGGPDLPPGQGMVFLGQIVRFARDRRHPESLGLEAADVLRRLVEGTTSEPVDRALEDLLGGGSSA